MEFQASDFIDVLLRAKTLGYHAPTGVTVLPHNFHNAASRFELYYESYHLELREFLRTDGVIGTSIEGNEEATVRIRLSEGSISEWLPPTIFIAGTLLKEKPALLDQLLNSVETFLYNKFTSVFGREPTSMDIIEFNVVKLSSASLTYQKISYRGSWKNNKLEGLQAFGKLVRKQ
jgi:hypothetical protein